ncbi:MAG: DNA repair protein RecN [Pseudomonadota bacterium]
MLTALYIQDYVLIKKVSLTLGHGLTALTGETGAGKSISLDALGLAIGGRASKSAVRAGADQGVVVATFDPPVCHPVWDTLNENSISIDDDQIVLRRIQRRDGKTNAFINDQPVSISVLRQVGESLLEVHGQHDGRGFFSASTHRELLDEFGGAPNDIMAVATLWGEMAALRSELDRKTRDHSDTLREAEYFRHVVEELRELSPKNGEETLLAARRKDLMANQKVREDLSFAREALGRNELQGKLSDIQYRVERAASSIDSEIPALAAATLRVGELVNSALETEAAVETALDALDINPDELDRVEQRLFTLRAAGRKHSVAVDQLQTYLNGVEKKLGLLESGEEAFSRLEQSLKNTKDQYSAIAAKITARRRKSAKLLDKAVNSELASLKLGAAVFETMVSTDTSRPNSHGHDSVEFLVATNQGSPAGPMKTIASGGELSRFILAIKAALAAKESRTVIIFDEVDAGVGGAVADAVGERLSRLAQEAQVLVVTHSPQVAARASHHWRIEKSTSKSTTTTSIAPLDDNGRVEEIARMLSGAEVTQEARAAARKLLMDPMKQSRTRGKKRKTRAA